MAKVSIKGQVYKFSWEYSLTDAIALEESLGMTFGQYRDALRAGSAKAAAGFTWLVLRQNGEDVPLADILSGKYALSIDDLTIEADEDPEGGEGKGPEGNGIPLSSDTTTGSGSPPSPSGSATRPRRSGRSPSTSSTT
jgi:hypothetical protein